MRNRPEHRAGLSGLRRAAAVVIVWCVATAAVVNAHPFHTSIAEVEWNASTGHFEVALRMDSLALERILSAVTARRINLDVPAKSESAVRQYVADRFVLQLGSEGATPTTCQFNWVGMELEKLDLWAYFELCPNWSRSESTSAGIQIQPAAKVAPTSASVPPFRPASMTISNSVLTDDNPLQVNFVTITSGENSATAHLTTDQPQAVVTLSDESSGEAATTADQQSGPFPPPPGMKRLLTIDFQSPDELNRWEPTDAAVWAHQSEAGKAWYALTSKRSDFNPEFRSPFNRSLLKDVDVGSFVLDVRVRSTIPDYNHRDLCVFFGYQDDAHLYYVHLGKRTDDHANQIFIVNDAPRTKISQRTTAGIPWDDEWHNVRVVRNVKNGSIAVFFDNMEVPVMTATDLTFRSGRLGIGSFDDTGHFDDFSVWVPVSD